MNRMEAEKVVRWSTIPLVSSSYVKASIHLQHPHGTVCVCSVHNMVCGVVLSLCLTVCPSPGGYSPKDGDCTEWREKQVHQGDAGSVDHHRSTEESHSKLAVGDQYGQEHDGGCSVTSDHH